MTFPALRSVVRGRGRRRAAGLVGLVVVVAMALAACTPQPPKLLSPVPPPNLPAPPNTPGPGAVTLNLVHQYQATYGSFSQPATHEAFSNPAVGIIDRSGQPSIVVGGMDGHLRAWHLDGTVVLDQNIDGWAIQASPVLYDMNGDGILDVVVATTGGTIAVLQPSQVTAPGYAAWQFAVSDTPRPNGLRGFFATPAVADLNRDGVPEIVDTSWDHHLWAWHRGGAVVAGFPVFLQDTSWSSPAVADLDGDGYPEIVVGGDMDNFPGAPYPAGGLLWGFWGNGTVMPGFPISLPGQTIWSTPAIGDLNGDGRKDIVVGTGLNWPDPAGRFIYAFDMGSHPLSGFPVATSGRMMSSPAIADIEGNGHPDVVALMEDGKVIAFRPNGQFLWATCNIDNVNACHPGYGVHGSVSVADVNHDGVQDVVSMAENWMRVLDGHTGAIKAQYAVPNSCAPASQPTIAQLQGTTWIIQAFTSETNHDGTPGVGDTETVMAWSTGQTLGRADWPMFKQNNARTL